MRVYNPFDVLLYLDKKLFRPYWFETGTPTFLIKLLMKERYYSLENLKADDEIVEQFDVDRVNAATLLFQTGYLTIRSVERMGGKRIYTLTHPNLEVKASLTDYILDFIVGSVQEKVHGDMDGLREAIKSLFSSIPNDWFRKNDINEYEGFYVSALYFYISALGLDVRPEDPTNRGLAVNFDGKCYIFEFKVVEGEGKREMR